MRIITGSAKGTRLETLDGEMTRPTSERVKEAIFSMIQFDVEGKRILDLFGGSGQLGLEALSRGADIATFVDSSRDAAELIKRNAQKAKLFDRCRRIYNTHFMSVTGKFHIIKTFLSGFAADFCHQHFFIRKIKHVLMFKEIGKYIMGDIIRNVLILYNPAGSVY